MKKELISGVIAGLGFIFIFLIGKNLLVSLFLGLILYLIFYIFFFKTKKQKLTFEVGEKNDYIYVVSKGLIELNNIKKYKGEITDEDILISLENIINKADRIFNFAEKNKEKVEEVRTFTEYYLPTISKILENYIGISKNKIDSKESKELYKKISAFLKDIDDAFSKQLDALFSNKILDTKVEIDSLTSALSTAGLIDKFDK